MSTYTDRYVHAVTRLLPERQRPEIAAELRSTIDDMVQARSGATADDDAVRAVLVELGDPGRLAASYVEQPRALIGQELFPEYLRVLKVVGLIAVPVVATAGALGALFDEPTVGKVVVGAMGGAFHAAVQVGFWVTLVYAFAERWKADNPWTPDALPEVPTTTTGSTSRGDTAAGIVVTVLVGAAVIWQHVASPLRDDAGERVPFLHPDLWNGPAQVFLGLLAVGLVIQGIVFVRRRWTYPLAIGNVALNLIEMAGVIWLTLNDRLVNRRFWDVLAQRSDEPSPTGVNPWVPILVVAVIAVWDSIECLWRARAAGRHDGQAADGAPGAPAVSVLG